MVSKPERTYVYLYKLTVFSSTPILSKVLEDFVVSWMIEDVGEHIDSRQFGSLKGSSTTYCLLDLIHNWLSELDNPGCYLRACFLDFSKAFDRIDHTIVIRKLIDCCPVWHNALPIKLSDSIKPVQKRALRVCITSHRKNGVV